MKKVISLLLVCMMMLSMVTVVSAANAFTISLDDNVDATSKSTSDYIAVPIRISNFPDNKCVMIEIGIKFDHTKVQFQRFWNNSDPSVITDDDDDDYDAEAAAALLYAMYKAKVDDMTGVLTGKISKNILGFTNPDTSVITSGNQSGSVVTALFTAPNAADEAPADISINDSEKGNNILTFAIFKKIEGQTGIATVTLDYAKVAGGGDGSGEAVTYSSTDDNSIVSLDNGSIKLTETYSATVGTGMTNGTISLSAEGKDNTDELDGNETITVTPLPAEGYVLDKVYVGDAPIDGTTFDMAGANVVVTATFKPATYTISYVVNEQTGKKADGTDGEKLVDWTDMPAKADYLSTVNIKDALGYKSSYTSITAVNAETSETVEISANLTAGTFVMPACNVKITADAKQELAGFDVAWTTDDTMYTVNNVENLTNSITEGTDVKFTVTPKPGYKIDSVTADSVAIATTANDYEYSFKMPANAVNITVAASAIERVLDPNADGSTITITETVSNVADITFTDATASIGEPVKFTVMPKSGEFTIDKSKIKVFGTNDTGTGTDKELTITWNDKGIQLMGYGYEGSVDMPADGVLLFSVDGTATKSALAELTKVKVSYKAKVLKDGTTDQYEIDEDYYVDIPVTSFVTTKSPLEAYAAQDNGAGVDIDNPIKLELTISDKASAEILYDGAAYNNDVELGNAEEKTFTIKVTAEDGITYNTYTLRLKNSMDPAAGATMSFEVDDADLVVEKGQTVTAKIIVKGLPSKNANSLDLNFMLPTDDITNANNQFGIDYTEGEGIVGDMNWLVYDEVYSADYSRFRVVSTATSGTYPDNCEVAVISFTVHPETDEEYITLGTADDVHTLGNGGINTETILVDPLKLTITENMTDEKAKAIEKIENYLDERNYTYEQWNITRDGNKSVLDTIKEYKEKINATTSMKDSDDGAGGTVDGLETVLDKALKALDDIQQIKDYTDRNGTPNDATDDGDDAGAREGFKTVISKDTNILKIDTKNDKDDAAELAELKAKYATEDWTEIEKIVTDAKNKIAASESREEDILNGYVLEAQAKIAAVATLANRKAEAKAKIVVDESKYIDEALATGGEVASAIAKAKEKIDECTTTTAMNAIVTTFIDEKAAPANGSAITENVYTLNNLKTTATSDTVKIKTTDGEKEVAVEGGSILVSYTDSKAVVIDTVQTEKISYLNAYVATVCAQKTIDNQDDLYTKEAQSKIEIYKLIAEAKIEAATSETDMNKAIEELIIKVAAVPTVADAAKDAFKTIITNDKPGYDIEDIVATTVENVNPAKEALYEVGIEKWKADNGIDGEVITIVDGKIYSDGVEVTGVDPYKKEWLQTIINEANSAKADGTAGKELGNFNLVNGVEIQDPSGAMNYTCNTPNQYVEGIQNIVNGDIHTPGDGIITVFDVVEIMKIIINK